MTTSVMVYVALGSNLDEPLQQVTRAIEALYKIPGIHLLRRSRWFHSQAVGPGKQADYINGVVELETSLAPTALLAALQAIENRQGRQRDVRWGPRTLDLDILLYGDVRLDTAALQLPHPRIRERHFVLAPLADLVPTRLLEAEPGAPKDAKSETIASLLARLPQEGLWPVAGETGPVSLAP